MFEGLIVYAFQYKNLKILVVPSLFGFPFKSIVKKNPDLGSILFILERGSSRFSNDMLKKN